MGALLDHLGRTCAQARTDAGLRQIDIAAAASVSHVTISRFETGQRLPREVEQVVEAYAEECGSRVRAMWAAALEAWPDEP